MNPYINSQQNPYAQQNPYLQRALPGISQNSIQWVQGIEGAKAYQLIPNGNAMMLDSENDGIFYIKTSDNVGMCNLRVFRFEEITEQQATPSTNLSDYVRKDELENLINSILGGTKDEQPLSTVKSSKDSITK